MPTAVDALQSTSVCNDNLCGDRVVCRCLNVTESEIQTAISAYNVETVRELGKCTGAGKGCMSCHGRLKAMVAARQC